MEVAVRMYGRVAADTRFFYYFVLTVASGAVRLGAGSDGAQRDVTFRRYQEATAGVDLCHVLGLNASLQGFADLAAT